MFQIKEVSEGEIMVIKIPRRLNLRNSEGLKTLLKQLTERGKYRWVMDLSKTEYMDSSGLAALVSQIATCHQNGGNIYLAAPSDFVLSLLEITHLNRVLKPFDSVTTAIQAFQRNKQNPGDFNTAGNSHRKKMGK